MNTIQRDSGSAKISQVSFNRAFDRFDRDGDGGISKEEMIDFYKFIIKIEKSKNICDKFVDEKV